MINHCKNNGLSICDMKDSPNDQTKCRHYEKSTFFNRCMYLIYDNYCDCLTAQRDRNGYLSDEEIAEIEESKIDT